MKKNKKHKRLRQIKKNKKRTNVDRNGGYFGDAPESQKFKYDFIPTETIGIFMKDK